LKFRYSSVSCAHECLRKFKLIYVDGLETDSNSIDLEFGTALHLGLKAHFDGEDPLMTFNMYWQSVESKNLRTSRLNWQQLYVLGQDFITRFVRLHSKKFKALKTEESFEIELAGEVVTGTIDFVGHYDGVPSIFDWKTSASRYKHSKLQKNEQLWLYAHAAKKAWGFNAEQVGYKVFVKGEESIQTILHPITEIKMENMINNFEVMIKDLAARKQFPRNPNCWCPFPEKCYGERLND
jgi:hypothetical protein